MAKLLTISLAAVMVLVPLSMWADDEAGPYPYVTASEGGRYYFRMQPDPNRPFDRDVGSGVAYEVVAGKMDKLLWTTKGWYSFSVHLSHDGHYLVRLGNWPRGHKPSEADLAVAFYKSGTLLKSYNTKGLIRDPSKVEPSVSHYQFLRERPGFVEPYGYTFGLVTVDGVGYTFDVRTGKILQSKKVD